MFRLQNSNALNASGAGLAPCVLVYLPRVNNNLINHEMVVHAAVSLTIPFQEAENGVILKM